MLEAGLAAVDLAKQQLTVAAARLQLLALLGRQTQEVAAAAEEEVSRRLVGPVAPAL
jgi:hypothetical protein